MLIDSHVHCHEFPPEELEEYRREWRLVCVSDDLNSSMATLRLEGVVKCVGVHPWQVERADPTTLSQIANVVNRGDVTCLGEVGLDRKFTPHSYDKQLEYFRRFLQLAREFGLALNVHAAGAWLEVVEELRRVDVDKALIHWYTGPLSLLEELRDLGFYISINPAVVIQKKHQEVAKSVDRRIVVVESDGPYLYREMRLTPAAIHKTIEKLAELWEMPQVEVAEVVRRNAVRLWKL